MPKLISRKYLLELGIMAPESLSSLTRPNDIWPAQRLGPDRRRLVRGLGLDATSSNTFDPPRLGATSLLITSPRRGKKFKTYLGLFRSFFEEHAKGK